MARLNNLLVTGISRFLDKIKTPKVETDNIESTSGKINTLRTKAISTYFGTQSGMELFSTGSSGQVLTSDGTYASWQNINTDSITSGTLPVSRGGTGKTTGKDAANYFINSLSTGFDTPSDSDYYVSQYAGGGSSTTTYHRRQMYALWSYIKGKISSWMKNNTSAGSLGWTSTANDTMPITSNTLAYWNGAYSGTSSNLTCVGTIKNGQWNASTIGVSYGGTGAQTLTSGALLQGNGTSAVSAAGGKGSVSVPIYIDSNGKPQTITSYSGSSQSSIVSLIQDTRSVNDNPSEFNRSVQYLFKQNSTVSLPTNATYSGVMVFKPWDNWSGGPAHELAFHSNGNLYHRVSTGDSTWTSWRKLLQMSTTDNVLNESLDVQNQLSANSVTAGQLLVNGNATFTNGLRGNLSGRVYTSFKNSVAMGSYQPLVTTIADLCNELRYSSGCSGSVSIGTNYSANNITISSGWYNFFWMPHRSGGVDGRASGDNCNYGSLLLSGITVSGCYLIRYSSSSIAELQKLNKSLTMSIDSSDSKKLNISFA